MDAPPYGRAGSDAPPHSGLSPILFSPFDLHRPFYTQRPFAPLLGHRFATRLRLGGYPRALPRFPATTASSDYCFRFRAAGLPSSLAELSRRAASFAPPRPRSPNRIGHEVLTSHIETCWSRGFRVNETLRRKFTCVAAYFFVRQDSRTSVALCTACRPNRMSISLRFSSFQLIVHVELRLAYLYQ